jgi:hypothetical protein
LCSRHPLGLRRADSVFAFSGPISVKRTVDDADRRGGFSIDADDDASDHDHDHHDRRDRERLPTLC